VSKTAPVGYHGFEFWVYDVSASILSAQAFGAHCHES
jgi:hypothetical protein